MKAWLAALLLAAWTVVAHAGATQEHPLEDAAKVVPDADEPALEDELRTLRTQGVDLAVIVINSTGGQTIEAYARKRAKGWATGTTPAAVFVLAVKDRKSRLEVSDPLRAKFPDARAQSILDNIKGYLRSSDYTGGIRAVITEVRNGVGGVAADLESPHPQVDEPNPAVTPPVTAVEVAPQPAYEPTYEPPPRKRDSSVLIAVLLGGGGLLLGAFLWARMRVARRATLTANAMEPDRPVWLETLWCVLLIIGGVLYIAAIVLMSSNNSRRSSWSSSSSGWSGGGGSSSSSGGGGWSGGGASSGW
ncbi:MAG: TPM domain-containing protein [Myxococcales bacterium]|nr:TPM domain-containing protein [Myxococcales bacterium]